MPLDPEIALALERVQAGGWLPLSGGSPVQARTKYRDLSLVRRGEGYLPEPVAEVGDTTFAGPGPRLRSRRSDRRRRRLPARRRLGDR
jgi:hypothetical protein